ncbi:EAL and HDOD domain-containing protein [Candidatus Reidiella endopervernicosa]|uniref:HDOD domain-containing protein n=1 Tax=Candidatus Reidiella endopervernicosa TaxID=2738883 RepID=A0A6N0HWE8_9GAMM|nr:HDOD domain-containing protein [Candidatus Reidiella endopervernicosa]QKQ26591.1 HDOD domain-containing protein [Candidatus Reidiella endopervernicosa]
MADELHEDVHINEDVYIGRQPIYNAKLELVGYELLYRDNSNNNANFNDGDYASSQVIINTFMELGLENIVGSSLAFINLTRGFFNGDQPFPLAKEQVVLEFLEDIDPDQTVLDGLTQLRENGFRIALDDYIYDDQHKVLLDYADIVKVDVAHVSDEQLPELVALYKERGATLLAEKVESYGQFTRCQALGFNYFQGYFFCKPKIIQGKQLPSNRIAVMNLLAEVQNPEVEISTLEEKITNNVTLSFRLLRYINCASFALRREVESVHQAIVLLGLQNIKNWLSLMLMAKGGNDKPHELMTTALLRARMCETLAADQGLVREQAFTVGEAPQFNG